ncbi:hypothetical protein M1O47_04350, partial [Dehalococcoidia bacterium]|nr:hypothetical protein [Dehalococcoidia bacterium]
LTDTTAQRLQSLLTPVLNVTKPVITLRKDVTQPHYTRPAEANPPPVAMRRHALAKAGESIHPTWAEYPSFPFAPTKQECLPPLRLLW